MARVKLATVWLGGCSGCHMSFLDLDEWLIELSERVELVYSPFVDAKEYPEGVDVVLVEGAIANEDHLEMIRKVRDRSRILISFGDCVDINSGISIGKISVKFHNTLVETIVAIAKRIEEQRVILTGGCFQNKYLIERAIQRLKAEGFHPYWQQRSPRMMGVLPWDKLWQHHECYQEGNKNVSSSSRQNHQYQ